MTEHNTGKMLSIKPYPRKDYGKQATTFDNDNTQKRN